MKTANAFGYFLMAFAVFGAVFYVLWWAGAIPFLHRDDAVRLTALVVTIAILLAVGFIGYVTVTTKPPKPITPRQPTQNQQPFPQRNKPNHPPLNLKTIIEIPAHN